MVMTTQRHSFHLVDPSLWPFVCSSSLILIITGFVMFIHNFSGGPFIFFFSFLFLISIITFWWRDVIREGTFEGQHTSIVQFGFRFGMLLFILSEVMFFVSFFWAFFWASLSPVPEIGSAWPPLGITVFETFEVPFLNTIILLLSGFSITWSHHSMVFGNSQVAFRALFITIFLAIVFTLFQGLEYYSSGYSISDGIYGSVFFIATGFHGFHVIVGSVFLTVCIVRLYFNHFTKQHHFGFEAAAWYWHFVDVVWLFLFVSIYWWGNY